MGQRMGRHGQSSECVNSHSALAGAEKCAKYKVMYGLWAVRSLPAREKIVCYTEPALVGSQTGVET